MQTGVDPAYKRAQYPGLTSDLSTTTLDEGYNDGRVTNHFVLLHLPALTAASPAAPFPAHPFRAIHLDRHTPSIILISN